MRDMVFEHPEVAGAYLGRYLSGGQLERFLEASDRSWQPLWVSPVLLQASGWSLERCQWVRQGWHVKRGTWRGSSGPFGGLTSRFPSWWFRPEDRDWVLSITQGNEQMRAGRSGAERDGRGAAARRRPARRAGSCGSPPGCIAQSLRPRSLI